MKKITDYLNESILNESGLARLWKKSEDFDCGIITAHRGARRCNTGKPYTRKENQARNGLLLSKLKQDFKDITRVIGYYIEDFDPKKDKNKKGDKEVSFFVCDSEETGKLESIIKELGEFFEQDTVAIMLKGQSPKVVGTNHCPDNKTKYGKEFKFSKTKYGKDAQFMTKIKGRPFVFESIEYVYFEENIGGKQMVHAFSEYTDIEKFIEHYKNGKYYKE